MGEGLLDPMAQDEEIEREMLGVEEERFIPPQMDPEPGMGAAAAEAAVYDTSPSLPHQNPSPIPAETAQPGTFDMAQLVAILAGMNEKMENNINEKMEANTKKMEANTNGMREEMKAMRGRCRIWVQACRTGLKN